MDTLGPTDGRGDPVILLVACNTPDPDTGTMPPMDMEETLESPSEAEDLDPGDAFQAAITAGYVESLHGGTTEPRYAYDGQVPGPTFREIGRAHV